MYRVVNFKAFGKLAYSGLALRRVSDPRVLIAILTGPDKFRSQNFRTFFTYGKFDIVYLEK